MPAADRFQTTMWSEVRRAQAKSTAALDALLARYRPPVCGFLRAKGLQAADAEDLTQEVFQRILEKDLLARVDRSKGRFRWLLLGITRNLLREHAKRRTAKKRGGGRAPVALEGERGAPIDFLAAPEEDESFDRLWVANLVDQAVAAAREDDRARGVDHVALLLESAINDVPHAELARRHGIKVQDVKNRLHRARKRISEHLLRIVRSYASSIDEYQAELAILSRYVGDGRLLGGE